MQTDDLGERAVMFKAVFHSTLGAAGIVIILDISERKGKPKTGSASSTRILPTVLSETSQAIVRIPAGGTRFSAWSPG